MRVVLKFGWAHPCLFCARLPTLKLRNKNSHHQPEKKLRKDIHHQTDTGKNLGDKNSHHRADNQEVVFLAVSPVVSPVRSQMDFLEVSRAVSLPAMINATRVVSSVRPSVLSIPSVPPSGIKTRLNTDTSKHIGMFYEDACLRLLLLIVVIF